MADDTTVLKATCLCKNAHHQIIIPTSTLPLKGYLCSCTSCRRLTGTLALTTAELPPVYAPSTEILDKLTRYDFSPRRIFYHCSTCGSQIVVHCKPSEEERTNGQKDYWHVFTGSLEQADGIVEFVLNEHIADTIDGGFSDWLMSIKGRQIERWPHSPGQGQQLPLDWQDPQRPNIEPSASDKLHCQCKCGGVEFWLARPSERSKNAASEWPDVIVPYHSNQPRADGSKWWLRDNDTKFLGGVCACNSCRLDSGCEWVEWAFVPTIDISLDAEGRQPYDLPFGAEAGWGTLKGYKSSISGENSNRDVWRYHCGTCGAMVFFTCDERTNLIDVGVGLLDAPEGARAETWLEWATNRLSFREDSVPRAQSLTLAVEDGLKKFAARSRA